MIAFIIVFNVICILAHKLLAPYGIQTAVLSEESLKERERTLRGDQGLKTDETAVNMPLQVRVLPTFALHCIVGTICHPDSCLVRGKVEWKGTHSAGRPRDQI